MRQPTPNILDELMPVQSEATELRSGLRWDYSQLGDAASAVIEHTIEIKRNERRANESVIEAGRHLIAVRDALQHGQWMDWLETEFSMSDRTARTMISIAERFDGKLETVSNLGQSVLGLLASPSVPEAAVEEVIQRSQNGETVTKATAKAVIDQHKPTRPQPQTRTYASGLPALEMPRHDTPKPTAPIVVDGDRPLPAWTVTLPDEIAEVLTPDAGTEAIPDMRIAKISRLINVYSQTIGTFDEYGNLTGSFTETLPAQRELEKLIKHLRREMALLEGQPVEDGWAVQL